MKRQTDITLNCSQCGRQFVLNLVEQECYKQKGMSFPACCPQCRQEKQKQLQYLTCSCCGIKLSNEASAYCVTCLISAQLNLEQRVEECQKIADETQSKLLTTESENKTIAESLRLKEQLLDNISHKVIALNQELEEAHQSRVAPQWFHSALNRIEEKLVALEQSQHESRHVILEQVQAKQGERGANRLMKSIKHGLRFYQK